MIYKWISVEDRLPENRHWCIVFANSELFLACYKHEYLKLNNRLFYTTLPTGCHYLNHHKANNDYGNIKLYNEN